MIPREQGCSNHSLVNSIPKLQSFFPSLKKFNQKQGEVRKNVESSRHEDRSTDTLESNIGHVCQPAAPQVNQLWYKKVGNISLQLWDRYLLDLLIKKSA